MREAHETSRDAQGDPIAPAMPGVPATLAAEVAALPDPLAAGNRAPPCFGVGLDRSFYSFEAQCGRAAALILAGRRSTDTLAPVLADFGRLQEAFTARKADIRLITDDNPALLLRGDPSTIGAIDCGDFLTRCGVAAHEVGVLLLDRGMRIAMWRPPGETGPAQECLDTLDRLPGDAPRDVAMPAPAIVLPNLLPLSVCHGLIALFDEGPSIDGGVARIDASGTVRNVVDHGKKHRRDLFIEEGTVLHASLQAVLLDRCRPEILKAFGVRVAYTDRILISRYDDTGGWFRRHRDNEAENVSFREFALSLNLNTGAYEGGHLLFPEYNDDRHAPPAGGGLIFSSHVLHEAAPVTQGRRYVLLTFLHGEAAETRRRERDKKALAGQVGIDRRAG